MKVVIMAPGLSPYDAVSNDVIKQRKNLLWSEVRCHVYAELFEAGAFDFDIISKEQLLQLAEEPETLIIYHHAVYWRLGEEILNTIRCPVVMKYHNITPAGFFRKYDRDNYHATLAGSSQTRRLIEMPHMVRFIGASAFNVRDLVRLGVPPEKTGVIAPYHCIEEFKQATINPTLHAELEGNDLSILFVGRVVPNKGFEHLIRVINRYVEIYGTGISLNIVGSLARQDPRYNRKLQRLVNRYKLGSVINFRGKVGLNDIHTLYRYSDVFLLMSEHEGFCVPILEAQSLGLPVVALNRCAVPETLGEEQILLNEPDPDAFAAAINRVGHDKTLRAYLASQGRRNVSRFSEANLSRQNLEMLRSL